MKLCLVFLFALALPCFLSAQTKIYEETIGWKGKNIELHTISDRDKQQNAVFLMNFDSIRIFLLDNTATVVRQISLRRDLGEKLYGGFIKEGKLSIFMHIEHGEPHMHGWTFDLLTGLGEEYYIPFALEHERIAERISAGDHFLCFAVNKKAKEFVFYDFKEGKRYDSVHYQFQDGIWTALTKFAGFSRDVNVARFDQEGESSVRNAQTPSKIYLVGDTMYLLMNVDKGVTGIFRFNLQHRGVDYRAITQNNINSQEVPPSAYSENTALLDGKLYFVSVVPDSLHIAVRDLGSGSLLREFAVGVTDTIPFKNTPIMQEGSDNFKNYSRELTKTSQLIRKMLNGTAVIMASSLDSGRVALSVGSYLKVTSSGGNMAIAGGNWKGGIPTMTFMQSGGFYRYTWTKSARFKMLLDSSTLAHVDGPMPMSINDKIDAYTKGTPIPAEGETLFSNKGTLIYGYYDREDHKVILMKF